MAATLSDGASVTMKATSITLDAETVHAAGDISADGDVVAGGSSLTSHRDPNIQCRTAISDPPGA